jgi:hypothetical protein
MRPRRLIVRGHRWLSVVLLGWLAVISVTGAWLVAHDSEPTLLERADTEPDPVP